MQNHFREMVAIAAVSGDGSMETTASNATTLQLNFSEKKQPKLISANHKSLNKLVENSPTHVS